MDFVAFLGMLQPCLGDGQHRKQRQGGRRQEAACPGQHRQPRPNGVYHFSLAIRGVFDNLTDSFDSSRHKLVVNIRPSAPLKQAARTLSTEQEDGREPGPRLQRYDDARSGTADSVVTPGGGGHLLGRDIQVDPDDAETGIFFIAADGTETAVTEIQTTTGRHAYFVVPALAPGSYTLLVRGRFGQELIEGRLRSTLTAA